MSSASSLAPVRRSWSTRLLIACGITAALSAVLWLFLDVLLVASVWPAVESPPRQGEAVLASSLTTTRPVHDPSALASAVREPKNTWSCLAFIFVAAFIVTGARDALGRWFALTVAIAGVCAMLYHASATRELRQADIAGLYWGGSLLALIAARRMAVLRDRAGTGVQALLLWLVLGALAISATAFRNVQLGGFKPLQVPVITAVMAIVVGSMLLVYCLRQADPRKWKLGLSAMGLMGLGFLLEVGDHPGGAWCVPGALIQPHALWHLLCAASLGFAMECFDSPARVVAGRPASPV